MSSGDESMRNSVILFAMFWAASLPVLAAKPMTIEQLQQALAAAQAEHQSDEAEARQLADAKLTARLTGPALQQLIGLSPGPKTTQALHAIAGASAFLDPAANEILSKPAPTGAEQSAIFGLTLHYLVHTLPTLPNLLATRETEHYADTLRGLAQESVQRGELYWLGTHRAPISYRDGKETDDPTLMAASSEKKDRAKGAREPADVDPVGGLSSWGEFGPILKVVLGDSIKGKLSWARWEQENGKPSAVFQFSVDRATSHYGMSYCCEVLTENTNAGIMLVKHPVNLRQIGYHGYLEADPETGAILRITIEADLRPEDFVQRASMMVEFGPVKIGDSTYVCPTRSVSISVSRTEFESHGQVESANRLLLNDVEFIDYHRFGSESTLITAIPANSGQTAPSIVAAQPMDEAPAAAPAETGTAAKDETAPSTGPSTTQSPAPVSVTATVQTNAVQQAPPSHATSLEADKEILIDALNGMPGAGGDPAKASGNGETGGFTLKTTTRSVDVGLTADDKRGKPIADLKQNEVTILDNGRQQQVRGFYHITPTAAPTPTVPNQAQDTFTNTTPEATQLQAAPDLLILLMDESHLAYLDLNQARAAVLRFLAASRPTSRIALYSISERGFHVIQDVTQDHALVEKKLAAWTPDASAVAQAQALERRNRQQFDTVHNAQDLNNVNGNNIDAPDTIQTTDPELRTMGDNPLRYALEGMVALARHFASVPGHKSIAWISGDSVLAEWEDQAVGIEKEPKQLQAALLHTREALNEAQIALYAVDASAVEGGAIDASIKNRNVELNQVDQNGPIQRNTDPGRATAQMQQDTRGIQGPVRQLAESTGGQAFNKGSDLKATLEGIDRDSSSYYELAFAPDTAADGKFHTLQVNVPSRKDVVLRYRSGYMYAEDSANTQQRFQQAVWSPQDATAIGLTAEAVPADAASGDSTVKLRINFPGLALEQKDGRWTDQLYIFVVQRDDAIQKAEVSGDTLRLSLKQATYDTGMPAGIPYQRAVEVKSKLGSVRVIVVDGNSGRIGSVTLPSSALHP
jgi:VWFA-related protein